MELQHFECDTVCGFMVEGYNKDEISKIAIEHAKVVHPQVGASDKMIIGMITAVKREDT